MRVGLDLRLATPRLRRWVTSEAAQRCRAARPMRAVDLHLRRRPEDALVLAAQGPATVRIWTIEVDALEDALLHVPREGIAPVQCALVDADALPVPDMLALATGVRWWLRFEGDALQAAPPPAPTRPGGTPAAVNLRRAA